jgi:phosphoglycolate phosphatase
MQLRLYVFDLDGTLVDSLRDLAESANLLLTDCGADPLEEDAIGRMVGDGAAALVARAFASAGGPQPRDALERFLAIYDTRLLRHTRPYNGVPEALAALRSRASLAVLTNKPLGATRRILAGLDLSPYFDEAAVIGGDGPLPRKPDPGGLRHLISRAGVTPAETVLVGDSRIDCETARRAGSRACLVRYGFGFDRAARGCDPTSDVMVIDSPLDLVKSYA